MYFFFDRDDCPLSKPRGKHHRRGFYLIGLTDASLNWCECLINGLEDKQDRNL